MEQIDWKTVQSYPTTLAASLAKARLEDVGIPVFLANATMVDTVWHLSNAIGGVRLQVPCKDLQRAATVLSRTVAVAEMPDGEFKAAWSEKEAEKADSPKAASEGHEVDKALRIAMIGLIFEPIQLFAWWLLWKAARAGKLRGRNRMKAVAIVLLTIPATIFAYVTIVDFFLNDQWLSMWELLQREFVVGR